MKEKTNALRKRIYEIVATSRRGDHPSSAYDLLMIVTILASLYPLTVKNNSHLLMTLDKITVWVFIADYVLRLLTADLALHKGKWSFLFYPFTFMALVDLISILPSFTALSMSLRSLKVFRIIHIFWMIRTMKLVKAFRILRYSRSLDIIANVIRDQMAPLIAVATMAAGYILIAALVIFNVEPDTFNTYFDAVYWATVSLTTVGYGDIYAVSTAGRIVTMLSSFVGIAIVTLPSGIITAGYLAELQKKRDIDEDE